MWREDKKNIKLSFHLRNLSAWEVTPTQSRFAAGEKQEGKRARNQHSFNSGAQPTHTQIDPSWRTEKDWMVRSWEPERKAFFHYCVAFKCTLPSYAHKWRLLQTMQHNIDTFLMHIPTQNNPVKTPTVQK